MGIADWLFNGGDDRAAYYSDLDNKGSAAHRKVRLGFREASARSRAKGAGKGMSKKDRDAAAARARSWWGTNSGSHKHGGGWWD